MNIWKFRTKLFAAALALGVTCAAQADKLIVCTTTTELGSIVREVGGKEVEVVTFAKGTEDAHFVEARPSFIKELSRADMYVQIGLDLEIGWAPVLLRSCRNPDVQPGGKGYVDASTVITPRDVPTGPFDRSMGDVHARGNPHYLLDPVNGIKVARLIQDRLSALRPDRAQYFAQRFDHFRQRIAIAMVGEELAKLYDIEKMMRLHDAGAMEKFLQSQNQADLLGGWLGALQAYQDTPIVDDHTLWSYFVHRFGLDVVGHMEPKPGISPTTRHLRNLVESIERRNVRIIISSSYYDERYAQFLAEKTGATTLVLAHQVGSTPQADDYIQMFETNIEILTRALEQNDS